MKIVVVGAGYAGTIAANRAARKVKGAEVTVINPREEFVERVRLHERVAGGGGAATPLSAMLRDGVRVRLGTVERIGDGEVTLQDGEVSGFDYLFLAVGSTVRAPEGTIPVGTWEGAEQGRAALAGLPDGSPVTVVGGGLTGIETAAEVASARPDLRVSLVSPTLGDSLAEGGRRRVRKGLERLNVEVVQDTFAGLDPETGAVLLASGGRIASGLTLWAILEGVPDLAARSGLKVDGEGRAIVDETLRSVSDQRIFVVGDCAAVPGARAACATALPQGAHAADTLARVLTGRRPAPYSMGYAGQAISLGRRDAVIQTTRRDDSPRGLHLAGRAAAVAKETIVRYARTGARTAVYGWLRGPK
ncbi:FAD-dependent oxidoreductase [Actinocorallia sp. API 0066]|uniref:NAD(P)/FAD-dependent oxidoreductase n=1 Tax=Actinocorallia sp. API 0066 TaxID=2896846 RepID=UPI001E632706|nr:FAD-dependent oxidoreductase [Actinocorallia sp. API 0066]MCD0449263.1 FAD-dependent oxidoreductase [Actinocorallia sp. API 0066]